MSNELTVELFSAGTWHGIPFTVDDLKEMAANFATLKSVHNPPVKVGHNDHQKIADGQPALGWIGDAWFSEKGKDGKPKLMGKLTDVPEIVMKAIKAKRYNKLSVELEVGISYKGKLMKYVLSGVALLGADLPALHTLADLNSYMSRKLMFADNKKKENIDQSFTFTLEEPSMDELEKMKARLDKLEEENRTLKDDNHTLKADKEKFDRETKDREESEAKKKVTTARTAVTAVFEKAVTEEVISPATRDHFSKVLRLDDDDAVVLIDTKEVETLIKESSGKMFSKDKSVKDKKKDERDGGDAGTDLTSKAYDLMNQTPGLQFDKALVRVMRANPELAKEHQLNDEANAA